MIKWKKYSQEVNVMISYYLQDGFLKIFTFQLIVIKNYHDNKTKFTVAA